MRYHAVRAGVLERAAVEADFLRTPSAICQPVLQRRVTLLWAGCVSIALVSCGLVLRRAEPLSDLHIYYGALAHMQSGRPLYEYVAENGGPSRTRRSRPSSCGRSPPSPSRWCGWPGWR